MKIISLVENTSRPENIGCEHGLSLYIEALGKKILFDMGQSELFYENALALGVDLSQVDIAVISHGHYDHGGGLAKFLSVNSHALVYMNKNAFLPYYNGEKYIGLDSSLSSCKRIVFTEKNYVLNKGLTLVTLDSPPQEKSGLDVRINGITVSDNFDHEQYLLIEEDEKSVLISGCSHKGILQIAEHFSPDLLIGGFHLMHHELDDRLISVAKRLDSIGCSFYTCHCTGLRQYEFIGKYIKKLCYLCGGDKIII